MKTENQYTKQAEDFLAKFGIKFRATLSDSKTAPWGDASDYKTGGYRPHYRVTLSRPGKRLSFDFWDSVKAGQDGEALSAYSVLSCVSSDIYCPETFADFCAEYGYNEDSRKDEQLFRRASRFGKRLRDFFTEEETAALSEIQ